MRITHFGSAQEQSISAERNKETREFQVAIVAEIERKNEEKTSGIWGKALVNASLARRVADEAEEEGTSSFETGKAYHFFLFVFSI